MFLRAFDTPIHNPTPEQQIRPEPVKLNSTAIPFTRLYGGLLKGEKIRHPIFEVTQQRVEWMPIHYKDMVTYVRRAV